MAKKEAKQRSIEEMQFPDFNIAEVKELYFHDLTIPDEIYDGLLQKDRGLLIKDLEKVIHHAVDQYKFLSNSKVNEKNTYFVWHAVFLLIDLKATESLPTVLQLLKQDEELVGFYLGDGIIDFGWEIFYSLGNQNLPLLVDFAKTLDDDWCLRTDIIEALKQISLHEPERRLEVESYLRELLLHVSSKTLDDDIYIDDVAEKVIETIGQLNFSRLFTEVKRMFEEDKIPSFFERHWKDFEKEYVSKEFDLNELKQDIRPRKEIYTEFLETHEEDDDDYDDVDEYLDELDVNDAYEDSLEESEDDETEDDKPKKDKSYIDYQESHTPYVKKEPNVGRNDPCPCGSGKKYKKCHGKS